MATPRMRAQSTERSMTTRERIESLRVRQELRVRVMVMVMVMVKKK